MNRPCESNRLPGWLAAIGLVVGVLLADVPLIGPSSAVAQQNVTIAPTRVVFEDRDRTEELVLFNRGEQDVTYRISLIAMEMDEDGGLDRIDDEPSDDLQLAHELLRFAPRQVHLEPGESQRIRMSVRKPAELDEGEYRSHLLFQAVPEARDDTDPETGDDDLALRINLISGISIPAIVRHGELSADIDIRDLEFVPADGDGVRDRVRFSLNRDGDRSTYGEIDVEFVPDQPEATTEQPEPITLTRRAGTAVYTPNERRNFEMPIDRPEDYSLDEGRIRVTYMSEESGEPLATTETEIE